MDELKDLYGVELTVDEKKIQAINDGEKMKAEWTNGDSLLVIDMPSSCSMCKAQTMYKVWNEEQVKWKGYNDRLDECPLKHVHALKSGSHDYIIYERQYLYKNLEREFDLLKKAREFDESNISD